MDATSWLPPLVLASSFVTGIIIFFLDPARVRLRSVLNMIGAGLKVVLVGIIFRGVLHGVEYEMRFTVVLGFDFLLRVDLLSLLLVVLSTVLWFLTTLYAIGYMKDSPRQNPFFGFFSLCVTASVGVALAGNLLTFFIFYEFLTLSTYPLVIHKADEDSLRAGRTYLGYTLAGGAVLFVGVVWLHVLAGPVDFLPDGILHGLLATNRTELIIIFVILIAGLGVKAALVPLHGWLPVAMIAPAPVSALLHAVAVVKAGAFGIVRVVYDVYGVALAGHLGLLLPLGVAAAVTIVYGSLRALGQDELKKMLAYSTVSQLSYIMLGLSTAGVLSTTGSLVHLIHQGIMKITLFFCAGIIEKELGMRYISQMNGIARRLPVTMSAMTIAAFGMIGMPPMAGFVSKWYLGLGGLDQGDPWIVVVLLISTLLNAWYFLPVLHAGWFKAPEEPAPVPGQATEPKRETWGFLLWPTVTTALLSLFAGLFAAAEISPLKLAERIAVDIYISP
jgi:multicomponent Na+:H+ antiporter subunit D